MAWYVSQCWLRSVSPYGVNRLQWVNPFYSAFFLMDVFILFNNDDNGNICYCYCYYYYYYHYYCYCYYYHHHHYCCYLMTSLWRHQMETFSGLLSICAGNHQSLVDSPHKGAVTRTFDVSLLSVGTNCWTNTRLTGYSRYWMLWNWHCSPGHGYSDLGIVFLMVVTLKPFNIRRIFCRQWIYWSLRCSWSIAWRRCSNYIFILDLTPGFNGLGKDYCETRRETFKFWDLVRLIFEVWR